MWTISNTEEYIHTIYSGWFAWSIFQNSSECNISISVVTLLYLPPCLGLYIIFTSHSLFIHFISSERPQWALLLCVFMNLMQNADVQKLRWIYAHGGVEMIKAMFLLTIHMWVLQHPGRWAPLPWDFGERNNGRCHETWDNTEVEGGR